MTVLGNKGLCRLLGFLYFFFPFVQILPFGVSCSCACRPSFNVSKRTGARLQFLQLRCRFDFVFVQVFEFSLFTCWLFFLWCSCSLSPFFLFLPSSLPLSALTKLLPYEGYGSDDYANSFLAELHVSIGRSVLSFRLPPAGRAFHYFQRKLWSESWSTYAAQFGNSGI